MLSVEDFRGIDLRVGTIVAAEPVQATDRLLRVRVALGAEDRWVVAGLAAAYRPDDLVGLQVVLVANMAPATIRGVRSEGMLLGVGCDRPGEIALLTVNRPVPNGARVQ